MVVLVRSFTGLKQHIDHDIECVGYGPLAQPPITSVTIECKTCNNEILFGYEYGEGDDYEND